MPSSACCVPPSDLHSFPTRRSSDLAVRSGRPARATRPALGYECRVMSALPSWACGLMGGQPPQQLGVQGVDSPLEIPRADVAPAHEDRKSTRLNSSHANISYAVFCLLRAPLRSTLFPYTTLFRSSRSERTTCASYSAGARLRVSRHVGFAELGLWSHGRAAAATTRGTRG